MFDLGVQELVVIFVVALIVFGPKRLPELGRAIGKTMGQLRSAISDVKTEVEREIHVAETGLDLEEMPAWKKRDAEQESGAENNKSKGDESGTPKSGIAESPDEPDKSDDTETRVEDY